MPKRSGVFVDDLAISSMPPALMMQRSGASAAHHFRFANSANVP